MLELSLILCGFASASPDAARLLQAYDDARSVFERVECRLRFKETYRGPNALDGKVSREGAYEVRHDGSRWRITYHGVARYVDSSGKIVEIKETSERAVTDEQGYISANRNDQEPELQSATAAFGGVPQDSPLEFTDEFAVLFGRFHGIGTRTLTEILAESQLRVQSDNSIKDCAWRLNSLGAFGRTSIWFDPTLYVRRIERAATGNDLVNSAHVSDLPPVANDNWRPNGKLVAFDTVVEFPRLNRSKDKPYPAKFAITRIEKYESGQKMIRRYEGQIDELTHAPEFGSDAFTMTIIPEGASVQVKDSPNIEYEWRDGRISKVVNAATERTLASAIFRSTYSALAYFLVFAVLLISLLVTGMWVYRRARSV